MTALRSPHDLDDALMDGWPAEGGYDEARRVRTAAFAVVVFAGSTGTRDEPLEDVVVDLVANLMHLCDSSGLNWTTVADKADMHHCSEEEN